MPFNILAPVDGSEPSEHAIAWAIEFARRTGARLIVCSVVDPMLSCVAAAGGALIDPQPLLEALEADAERYCAAAVARAVAQDVAVTTAVLEGAPSTAIDDFANAHSIDLIVLGTHARHGFALGVLGSVTDAVVRSSRAAVLAVRANTESSGRGPVVVAIDDSQASAAAASFALVIAHALDAPVHLIHVGAQGDASAAALGQIALEAMAKGIACTTEICPGAIVDVLIAIAADRGAQILATGTHGRGGFERIFLGSVAEGLIRNSLNPVLTVRPVRASTNPVVPDMASSR